MSRAAVREILREIESLGNKDRLELDRELTRRLESEWKEQAAEARKTARRRKINQAAIDRTIERRRYGE